MHIVPAGVHHTDLAAALARDPHLTRVAEPGLLDHGQRVHVAAQQHDRPGPVLEHADHPKAPDSGVHDVASRAQRVGHSRRRGLLVE